MKPSNRVLQETRVNASPQRVWHAITEPQYARILGNVFDTNAYMASDWKAGSPVEFRYDPGKVVARGKITKLEEHKLIHVTYDFHGNIYFEVFTLEKEEATTVLKIEAGPYGSDYEAQKVVWRDWALKVKELSEGRQ